MGGSDEVRGWDPVGSSCDGTGKVRVRDNLMKSVRVGIALAAIVRSCRDNALPSNSKTRWCIDGRVSIRK